MYKMTVQGTYTAPATMAPAAPATMAPVVMAPAAPTLKPRSKTVLLLEIASSVIGTTAGGLSVVGISNLLGRKVTRGDIALGTTLGPVVSNALETLVMGKALHRAVEHTIDASIGAYLGNPLAEWIQGEKAVEDKAMGKPRKSDLFEQFGTVTYSSLLSGVAVAAAHVLNGELGQSYSPCWSEC